MKGRSLLGLMVSLTVLGSASLSQSKSATATPAPIFRPIIRDIQNQLPRGMVMRLPASLELVDYQRKRINIYPILEPYQRGEFSISLVSEPNCQARACAIGYISAFQQNTNDTTLEFLRSAKNSGAPITLTRGVRGTYMYFDPMGVSSGPYGVVMWEQNGWIFRT